MRRADLSALAQLADMAFSAAEGRMAALRAEEMRLVAQLDGLDEALSRRLTSRGPQDAALRAGADLRWERWVEGRRRLLLAELARLRARIEDARVELARDFGRRSVMRDIARAEADKARARHDRAADRGA